MYLGVDLGPSRVRVIIIDPKGKIVDSQSAKLAVSRLQSLWSEQNRTNLWEAFCKMMDETYPVTSICLESKR